MNRLSSLSTCLAFAFFVASAVAQMTQNQHGLTIQGCVQSHGGSYVLKTKNGEEIALTGADVYAHVGHEVQLKGDWVGEHATSLKYSGPTADAQRESPHERKGTTTNTFNVSSVKKMVSESCKGYATTGSSHSETSPNSTQPPQ